jgi:glycosyltransferase involved in cell wall biosynthesis
MATTTHDREVGAPSNDEASPPGLAPLQVVCLSPQPWGIDLPTNRQQVMRRIADAGHRVLYVDTGTFVGRHVAALLGSDERRSLLRQLVSTDHVHPGIRASKAPALLPWGHRFRFAARLNAALTAWTVRRRVRRIDDPVVLWLYDPCFSTCIGRSGERFAVYDCVDDYAEQSGADARKRAFLAESDRIAAERSRLVFATANGLVERHRAHNRNTHLVGNVGDYDHFAGAADPEAVAPEVAELARPVIGFAGNFLAEKVDFALLEAVAAQRPQWTLLLVGPVHDDTRTAVEQLAERDNVRWLGPVDYDALPSYVAGFDVATIPYLSNVYTRSCFPLKTFEYLAAGKPVVASGLPELEGLEPHVALAEGADAFVAAIEDALGRTAEDEIEARRGLARGNTWETRTRRLLELVATEL